MQETADLVAFNEEILNGKLHILCVVQRVQNYVKCLRWSFLRKRLTADSILDVLQGSEYDSKIIYPSYTFHCVKSLRVPSYSGLYFPAFFVFGPNVGKCRPEQF